LHFGQNGSIILITIAKQERYMQKFKKPPYYKQNITSLQQLQQSVLRITTDIRMGDSTKQQNIAKMFESYKYNTAAFK
tara:strand:+ start:759 stop:992 length:234 start_codon:yes stop_codon:yes gene_type:complete